MRFVILFLIFLVSVVSSTASQSPFPLNEPVLHGLQIEFPSFLVEHLPLAPREKKARKTDQEFRETLDEFISKVSACHQTFSLGVSLVKDDQLVFAKGYGFSDAQKTRPTNERTLFGIGSTTKAFTAVIAAMLVDEDKLDWKAPISTYLPNFKLYDEVATRKASLIDIISHRTGVPRNDLLWISGPNGTREQWVNKLQYFLPNIDFRDEWQYNNWMLMLAGYITEKVTQTKWEELIEARVFKELAMNQGTTTSVAKAISTNNYAHPWAYFDGEWKPYPEDVNRVIEPICAAGCISSNAVDMAKWMIFQLSNGTINGKRLLSPEQLRFTQSPREAIGVAAGYSKPYHPFSDLWFDYDLGWFHGTYQGHKKIWHSGGTLGHITLLSLLPDDKIGLFVSETGGKSEIQAVLPELAITWFATDLLLGVEPWLTSDIACNLTLRTLMPIAPPITKKTRNVKTASKYVGTYFNPAYDSFRITEELDQTLRFAFNEASGILTERADNILDLTNDDNWFALALGSKFIPNFLQFTPDSTGAIDSAIIPIFEPLSPPVFKKHRFS